MFTFLSVGGQLQVPQDVSTVNGASSVGVSQGGTTFEMSPLIPRDIKDSIITLDYVSDCAKTTARINTDGLDTNNTFLENSQIIIHSGQNSKQTQTIIKNSKYIVGSTTKKQLYLGL
jgi:hypothetical protein